MYSYKKGVDASVVSLLYIYFHNFTMNQYHILRHIGEIIYSSSQQSHEGIRVPADQPES
jgi:hypothetical protein